MNTAADTLLVAEITSPGDAAYDRETKKRLYAEAGIEWYLLVEPDFIDYESVTLRLFRLEGHAYAEHAVAKPGETLVSDQPFSIALNTDALVDF
jgi:Uma2 family endonuclease